MRELGLLPRPSSAGGFAPGVVPPGRLAASRFVWCAAAAVVALVAASCAHVGPPLPPLGRVPAPPENMAVVQEGGWLAVSCTLPGSNGDGSEIKGYKLLEIRGGINSDESAPTRDPGVEMPIFTIQGADLSASIRDRRFTCRLDLASAFPAPEGRVGVALRFQNERGHWSVPTPPVFTWVGLVAAATEAPRVEVGKSGIKVEWPTPASNFDGSIPAVLDGFQVISRTPPSESAAVVWEQGLPAPAPGLVRAVITDFAFDREYSLAVVPFRVKQGAKILGKPSPWSKADTRDVFPPDVPAGVTAVEDSGRVRVLWDPSPDPDVAGYLIRRAVDGGSAPVELTGQPVPPPSFLDPEWDVGKPCHYQVAAVDLRGNRSAWSPQAPYIPDTR